MKVPRVFGVGGIGRGLFFQLEDSHTLGRNESRLARQLDIRDYCKLHIVFHYVARFASKQTAVIPLGFVGDDEAGAMLRGEMESVGMVTEGVLIHPTRPTMLSVCLQYPDKSGCNVTSSNSACEALDAEELGRWLKIWSLNREDFVVALPEVPIETQFALLRAGTSAGAFRAASFTAAEAGKVLRSGILEECDLLALNQEETKALCGYEVSTLDDAEQAAKRMLELYPQLQLWLTVGAAGSVSADNKTIRRYCSMPVEVRNTGGAGDATLGGILAALTHGLEFHREGPELCWQPGDRISTAAEFGALLGGLSVSSPDSIDFRQGPEWVRSTLEKNGWLDCLRDLLSENQASE